MAQRTATNTNTAQIAQITTNGIMLSQAVTNIINTLPADPQTGYPARSLARINQLIIHHSAVSTSIGPDRIAKMQVAQGKPAIGYHFFISRNGEIFQTNPLTAIAAHTDGHDQASIGICFAGNFTRRSPSVGQLNAGRSLIQTLVSQFRVSLDNINGASELVAGQSPGKQWLQGQKWKNRLLSGVSAPTKPPTEPTSPAAETAPISDQTTALNTHIAQLTAQLAQAQASQRIAQNQIKTLNNQLTELQRQLSQAQQNEAQTTGLHNRIAQLEAELAQAKQTAQQMTANATELAALKARIAQLEAELATSDYSPNQIDRPDVRDVVHQLPHHQTARYQQRNPSTIKRIIIHHTKVAASVSTERIARIHIGQGQPGIAYHYLIRGDGTILQTNYDNTVAHHTQGYDQNSLAVAFAGNFTDVVPTDQQLETGAQLIAYLQQQFKISPDDIKGASELARTQSPGKQWQQGQRWQQLFFNKLTKLNSSESAAAGADYSRQLNRLQARIAELETLLSIAQEAAMSLGSAPITSPSTGSGTLVTQPNIDDIVDELPRHPNKRYEQRTIKAIRKIIVHHSAVPAAISAEQIAEFNVQKSDWPGIGFHYFIGVDGVTQQTNDLTTISYHTGGQNGDSIGVALAGDFDETEPNQAQITAGAHLIAWLLDHLNIALTAVHGHKEFAKTTCPGQQWDQGLRWRDNLWQAIQDNLAGAGPKGATSQAGKTLYHYLLFWQNKDGWAEKDLAGAANYIAHFRPTMGFSLEDAIDAEYVTIVGGPLGVSAEDEARLRASGCQVERIAGNSEAATKALLDNLARQNRRFLRLEG